MMAPPEISEYIVIHELSHLKYPNHGPKFARLLSSHAPNHKEHEHWLEDNSVKLIFTKEDL
jgi:predicted metal-dependent hydrolase